MEKGDEHTCPHPRGQQTIGQTPDDCIAVQKNLKQTSYQGRLECKD